MSILSDGPSAAFPTRLTGSSYAKTEMYLNSFTLLSLNLLNYIELEPNIPRFSIVILRRN